MADCRIKGSYNYICGSGLMATLLLESKFDDKGIGHEDLLSFQIKV